MFCCALGSGCTSAADCGRGRPQVSLVADVACAGNAPCYSSLEVRIDFAGSSRTETEDFDTPQGSGIAERVLALIPAPEEKLAVRVEVRAFSEQGARGTLAAEGTAEIEASPDACNDMSVNVAPVGPRPDAGDPDAGDADAQPLDGGDAGVDAGPPDTGEPPLDPRCELPDDRSVLFVTTSTSGKPFDRTDTSGVDYQAGRTPPAVANGICGPALAFDEESAAVVVAASPAFDLDSGRLSIWLNLSDAFTSSVAQGVASRDASGEAQPGHFTLFRTCENRFFVRLQNGGSHYQCSEQSLPANEWHKIEVGFGPAGLRLLVDDVEQAFEGTLGAFGDDCLDVVQCGTSTVGGIAGNQNPWVIGAALYQSVEGTGAPITLPFTGAIGDVHLQGTD